MTERDPLLSSHVRPARAADLGLEVPAGYWEWVTVDTRTAGDFVAETVLAMRLATPEETARREAANARGEVLPAKTPEPGAGPLPWLDLGEGLELLRARVWRGAALEHGRNENGLRTTRALPATGPVWVWRAGRVVLEVPEGASGRDVRAVLPVLAAV